MSPVRLHPSTYARLTSVALAALAVIVVTGAAVRLTGSGLGCPDWPTCAEGRIVAPLEYHAMIEFVNRTVTGLVSVSVMLAVLGSLARVPRRRDLTLLSFGLVAGVAGQILLGGLVVLFHLWPPLVMGHFVLSMVLLWNATLLRHRAREPDGAERRLGVRPDQRLLGHLLVAAGAVAILLGTVVTGSGPHAGSNDGELVERLPFSLEAVTRLHGISVALFLALAVATLASLRAEGVAARVRRAAASLVGVIVVQGAIGYTQYFLGVPEWLVLLHVAGAVAVWVTVVHLSLSMHLPVVAGRDGAADEGDRAMMIA
ncbi:MAG TPA: COX15/CtaA family protein [Acidimicrobiales bacterium]|nr:COX15/CtaA family protein [Acidimicrobiales bacterium]